MPVERTRVLQTQGRRTAAAATGACPPLRPLAEREELIRMYLPLVHKIARQLGRRFPGILEYEDLVACGQYGLVEAAARWDESRGTSFAAFAGPRIRGAMLDAMRKLDPVGRTVRGRARSIQDQRHELAVSLGYMPSQAEASRALGLTERQSARAEIASQAVVSLESLGAASERQWEPVDERASSPEDLAVQADEVACLRAAMRTLPERHRLVLILRYVENLTYAEVGRVLGVSASRASQLEAAALRRLRAAMAD